MPLSAGGVGAGAAGDMTAGCATGADMAVEEAQASDRIANRNRASAARVILPPVLAVDCQQKQAYLRLLALRRKI